MPTPRTPAPNHIHDASAAPLMGHALVNHLTDGHDLDYTDVVNHSVAWRNGAHDDLHQVHPDSTLTTVHDHLHEPETVEHTHEGYWPRGEEARLHLVNAHGWDSVKTLSHTLTGAELEHHSLHQPVPSGQALINRLRTRDTHPINVLAAKPAPTEDETRARVRILSAYHSELLGYLREVEVNLGGTWVLLDNDGIEVIVDHLTNCQEAGNDEQYVAAQGIASDIDKLLGVTQ